MHLYDPKEYPNLLPLISLTSKEIRQTIIPYKLEFSQERNREVEWGIKLPMFVVAFYDYVIIEQRIPNQKDFFDYYLSYNKDFFQNLNRSDLMSGIMARAFRTYPSLIRDVYFNKFIEEKIGTKCKVIYNTRLDIEEGIDLMIITKKIIMEYVSLLKHVELLTVGKQKNIGIHYLIT